MNSNYAFVTQRVVTDLNTGERRDALDQRWSAFLFDCGLHLVAVPNHASRAVGLWHALGPTLLVLTGGNDLETYGGDAPERDAAENALLMLALERGTPVLGVCRGMQMLITHFGGALEEVAGHVAKRHLVVADGIGREVNSYHRFGARRVPSSLIATSAAADGVIESIRGRDCPVVGVMWHPERESTFAPADIASVKALVSACAG